MPGFNTIGMDAVGVSSNNATQTPSTSLSCVLSSASYATAGLTTKIVLVAGLISSSTLNASISTVSATNLQAALQSASTFTATSLTATAKLQAIIGSQSTLAGDLTTTQVIPMFTPSSARTIFVQAASPLFTGGKWWTLTDPKKPRGLKDPDAVIDITFDWTSWLDDIGSVQISDVTFTLNGVSSVGSFSDGTKVTVFVSGGTAGSSATVSCKIKTLTTPSRTDERTIYIDIADE